MEIGAVARQHQEPEALLVERQGAGGDKVGHAEVVGAELLVAKVGDVGLLRRLQVEGDLDEERPVRVRLHLDQGWIALKPREFIF